MRFLVVPVVCVAFGSGLIIGRYTTESHPAAALSPNNVPNTPPDVAVAQSISNELSPDSIQLAAKDLSPTSPPPGFEAPPPPDVSFASPTLDFGKLLEGEARNGTLKIIRPAGATLKLGRIYCSCPCIVATIEKRDFAASEAAAVKVAIHSLSLEGRKSFPLYVEVLAPVKGILSATVKLEATRVPAKIAVVPDALHFGTVKRSKSSTVKLLNLTKRPLTLKPPICSIENVKVSVKELFVEPGQTIMITATAPDTGLPSGPVQGKITLKTDLVDHAIIEIPVDGTSL